MPDDVFVNSWGLARVLRLPREWLMAEADAGRIPCLRIGNRTRFSVQAVEAALAEQAAATAENGKRRAAAAQSDLADSDGRGK